MRPWVPAPLPTGRGSRVGDQAWARESKMGRGPGEKPCCSRRENPRHVKRLVFGLFLRDPCFGPDPGQLLGRGLRSFNWTCRAARTEGPGGQQDALIDTACLYRPRSGGGPARPVKDSGVDRPSAMGPMNPGRSLHFSESEVADVRCGEDGIYHIFLARPR